MIFLAVSDALHAIQINDQGGAKSKQLLSVVVCFKMDGITFFPSWVLC